MQRVKFSVYPQLRLKVYVDNIKLTFGLKNVIREAKLKLSLTEGGKKGHNKLIASNNFLESIFLVFVVMKELAQQTL